MTPNHQKLFPRPTRRQLRSTTVLPMVLGLGVAATGLGLGVCFVRPVKAAPATSRVLPDAISRDALSARLLQVACNPCNPCNPCAAGSGVGATECVVPRLAAPNSCNPRNPCNPCAAGGGVDITDAEAADVYDCVKGYMKEVYGVADDPGAGKFLG